MKKVENGLLGMSVDGLVLWQEDFEQKAVRVR